MAETQRAPRPYASPVRQRPAAKPRPRHPGQPAARPVTPSRPPLDATMDLRPPEPVKVPPPAEARPAPVPRTSSERGLLTVIVLGLGLNAAVLLFDSGLTRADVLLGSTVLLAGIVLLATLEICRRGGSNPPMSG